MSDVLFSVEDTDHINDATRQTLLQELESGKVIFFPNHPYPASNYTDLLHHNVLHESCKNISFDSHTQKIIGTHRDNNYIHARLQDLLRNYAIFALRIIEDLFPHYLPYIQVGKTHYRPAKIEGHITAQLHGNSRLHVDAVAATPVQGKRVLRIFSNINPHQKPRIWQVGEPFPEVVKKFAPLIPRYRYMKAQCLYWLHLTKTLRSPYDHAMLSIHDNMQLDEHYQTTMTKEELTFPPFTTWMAYTDQVSHAVISGQYLLEQKFYLPIEAMLLPKYAPLNVLQKNGLIPSTTASEMRA
ncbi:MAG: Kdo hydroxylase family protein [Legionellaceae bacterium]|nr:Kdo hydroxylase family protein [Legionellaceae bacterium]